MTLSVQPLGVSDKAKVDQRQVEGNDAFTQSSLQTLSVLPKIEDRVI